MPNKKLKSIQKDIRHYFSFLFDRGYKIVNSFYDAQNFGNWIITLEALECIIEITNDRDELLITFASIQERNNSIGLKPMIYFLTQGENFIGPYKGNLSWGKKKQYQQLANLLEKYIDQIEPYFRNDFRKHKANLIIAGKEYVDLLLVKHAHKQRGFF